MDDIKIAAFVEKSVIEGFTNLAAALQWYWPASLGRIGKKEDAYFLPIQEQNLITYIGASFLRNGFLVFNEVNLLDDDGVGTGKMDMLAVDLQNDIEIYIEAKGDIYSQTKDKLTGDSPLQLYADYERMQKCQVAKFNHHLSKEWDCLEKQHKFSLLMTTSHQDSIRNWWMGYANDIPQGCSSPIWSKFHGEILKSKKLISNWSIPLKTSGVDGAGRTCTAHGLYALLKR